MYSFSEQIVTTVLVLLVMALTMGLLLSANLVQKKVGENGVIVISKIIGLILASYATQSILTGLKAFFA